MQVVIDSVSLQHLLRKPRRSRRTELPESSVDRLIRLRRMTVALDRAGGLLDEWKRTCGQDAVNVLIAHWESLPDGVLLIANVASLEPRASRKLRELGFRDAIDRLVLRIALRTTDRVVISDDSDFWDPKRPNDRRVRGNRNAPVARFSREELGIEVVLLRTLVNRLER